MKLSRRIKATPAAKYKEVNTKDIYLIMAASGYLIDAIDDKLKDTVFYKNELKNKGNIFYKALVAQEQKVVSIPVDEEGAIDEMIDSYQYFENWLNCLWKIPEEKHEVFSKLINAIINVMTGEKINPILENQIQMIINILEKK